MAAVLTDVALLALSTARLAPEAHAGRTLGAAMAGLIGPGLGGAHRPLSWTPQVVANNPLARWCRAGIRAERLNRFQRGRPRDAAAPDGGDRWWHGLALAGCAPAGLDRRCKPRAPTSGARPGKSVPASDAPAMPSPPGASTAHRPALPPAVLDRLGAHEGGWPVGRQRGEGQTSASTGFQARAPARLAALQKAPRPRSLSADANRSPAEQAPPRHTRGFRTRMPTGLN